MSPPIPTTPVQTSALYPADQSSGEADRLRGVCLIDLKGEIIATDAQVQRWLQDRDGEVRLPCPIAALVGRDDAHRILAQLFGQQHSGAPQNVVLQQESAASQPLQIHLRLLESTGDPFGLVIFEKPSTGPPDVLDALTNLPDRRSVARRIDAWNSPEAATPFALLFIDLDDFKQLNDLHGHAAGDRALVELAARIRQSVRDEDLVARYGGDEFVVLLKDAVSLDDVQPVVERLRRCGDEPIDLGEFQPHIKLTIGVALSASVPGTVEALVDAADRDMYAQKRRLTQ